MVSDDNWPFRCGSCKKIQLKKHGKWSVATGQVLGFVHGVKPGSDNEDRQVDCSTYIYVCIECMPKDIMPPNLFPKATSSGD